MADLFPCPNKSDCAEEAADLVVRRNFTAELPDRNLAFAIFYPPLGFPGFPPGPNSNSFCAAVGQNAANICSTTPPNKGFGVEFPPVTGNTQQVCTIACANGGTASFTAPPNLFFTDSQSRADLLAFQFACEAAQLLCSVPLVTNTNQMCTVTCADGSTGTYIVLAGSFTAQTQAEADGLALALACLVAQAICDGTPITIFTSTIQSCTVPCATGSFTYTVPAGVARGLTQAEADAAARALACALAALGCSNLPPLFGNTAQTCSQDCAGQTVTYTLPANVFQAPTQADANLTAFIFACLVLSESCQNGTPPPPVTAPNTQQECSVSCPGGGSFTYIVPYNTFRADNQAAANAVAQTAACNLASINRTCIAPLADSACASAAYFEAIGLSGPLGGSAVNMSLASGALPPGVSISGFALSGVPVTGGTYSFVLRINYTGGHFSLQPCVIVVGEITGSLSSGETGVAYSDSVGSSGITNPVFSISGGSLPAGLSISGAGVISGTPTGSGTSNFVIQAAGDNMTCTRAFEINISASSDCPDWENDLNWGTATSVGDDPPTTGWVFAPQNIADDSWATVGGVAAFPPTLASLQWGNTGDLIYNGAGCNCNAHVFVSFGFTDPTEVVFTIQIEDITASNFLLVQTYNGNNPGTYDLPFALPNTFGLDHTIRVTVVMTATNTTSGGAASVSSNGQISNV